MLAADLAIAEQLAPRSTLVALVLNRLGMMSENRGDLGEVDFEAFAGGKSRGQESDERRPAACGGGVDRSGDSVTLCHGV